MTSYLVKGGNIWSCGNNSCGQLGRSRQNKSDFFNIVNNVNTFKFVEAGHEHVMALDIDGNIWSCGNNNHSQLGLGDTKNRNTFTKIINDETFKILSCGYNFSIAIDSFGNIWSCGDNKFGQLGLGNYITQNILTPINLKTQFDLVSCGKYHVMLLDNFKKLWGFGSNDYGELSLDDYESRNKPTLSIQEYNKNIDFIDVSCGENFTWVLDQYGCIWSCGKNNFGQLGQGNKLQLSVIKPLLSNTVFTNISCGYNFAMAIDENHYLWGCGNNIFGQISLWNINNFNDNYCDTLIRIPTAEKFNEISCHIFSTMALDIDQYIWVCGNNIYGQLTDSKIKNYNFLTKKNIFKEKEKYFFNNYNNEFDYKNIFRNVLDNATLTKNKFYNTIKFY